MGLLTALLTLPLAPVRGVVWVAEQVAEEAERSRSDPAAIHRELVALELDHDEGRIDSAERDARQEELIARLVAVSEGDRERSGGDG